MDAGPSGTDMLDGQTLSENERLIHTLETCFSNLMRNQQEQAKKQDERAEQLQQAVEALKQKAPATDKKTSFWQAYKTLADEHDEEFQRKYSTDLDTALIFAGLFSAVDSAFIIQIQPGIQHHGTDLRVLISQNLLYVSLFSTLLAALLAVLGKQWLLYYLAAGERGTLEARGLERQRKFDGLRRWKFEAVMQMFPLLLQIGLFLFSVSLSTYLFTVHISLAILAISFTSFGFITYTALLISAVAAPDSPYQTPLTPLVAQLIPTTLWAKLKAIFTPVLAHPIRVIHRLFTACSSCMLKPHLLPLSLKISEKNGSTPNEPPSLFDAAFPAPSAEVPAVSWVLETSADPRMIVLAAEMVVNLQWPSTMDARPQLSRLREAFVTCFDHYEDSHRSFYLRRLRDGMTPQALHCGRALGALQCIMPKADDQFHLCTPPGHPVRAQLSRLPELSNVVSILKRNCLGTSPPTSLTWALRVIPWHFSLPRRGLPHYKLSNVLKDFITQLEGYCPPPTLDSHDFANYLFCMISFLSHVSPRDIACVDKSPFQKELFERLLEVLLEDLKNHTISMDSAAQIIYLTGRLRNKESDDSWRFEDECLNTVYNFCGSLPHFDGWVQVVLATGLLTWTYDSPGERGAIGWIYKAMDTVNALPEDCEWDDRIITGLAGLLNALNNYGAPPAKEHIHLILRAISIPGDISSRAADLLLRNDGGNWFQDEELRPKLQKASAWTYLAHAYSTSDAFGKPNYACIVLGCTLAELPQWEPYIRQEPCSWIIAFWRVEPAYFYVAPFCRTPQYRSILSRFYSILSRFWNPDAGEYEFISDHEKALALTFIILSQVWQDTNFADSGVLKTMVQRLRCTALTVLRTEVVTMEDGDWQITPRFITAFSQPLHNSLTRAVAAIKNRATAHNGTSSGLQKSSPGEREVLDSAVKLLEDIASRMPHSEADSNLDDSRYSDLRAQFDAEIKTLEQSLYRFSMEAVAQARA